MNNTTACEDSIVNISAITIYSILFLLTLLPNLSLLHIIIRDKSLRNKGFNLYLINFSFCDSPPLPLIVIRYAETLSGHHDKFFDHVIAALYCMLLYVETMSYLFISAEKCFGAIKSRTFKVNIYFESQYRFHHEYIMTSSKSFQKKPKLHIYK